MLKFNEMSLIEPLLRNLHVLGYDNPTAIQAEAIPFILEGNDLLGIAQTGTGKTAAFCLPVIQRLKISEGKGIRTLILAPTRELVSQIQIGFDRYAQGLELNSVAIFGGVDQKPQVKALRDGVDVIVATPGRLLDLMKQGHIRLAKIEVLILDEADMMMDMGFIDDLHAITDELPDNRQTLFFSATMPEQVVNLSRKILKNPKRVEVSANSSTVLTVEQKVIFCTREDKFQLLRKILKTEERELVVIFTKTKNSADKVKEYLRSHRIASGVFHGDKSQEDREQALANFKDGGLKILIATDIASRGLDVQGVSHVINFELPLEAEAYVHRIGRTARAGKEGKAISFVEESEKPNLERIEKLIQLRLATEKFKGVPEASGIWMQEGSIRTVLAPTPGKSQEKTAYLDHSKRRKLVEEGAPKPKAHPGFKNKKKKR
ncbi:MAG TPA: DEAD/DEAH box helicase [Bacteriovoracaceae bacterium]|nr:DEAD/DEAH box helicase [Bacteriovoracaceae bacterium]